MNITLPNQPLVFPELTAVYFRSSKKTFDYSSSLWINKETYSTWGGFTGLDFQETKSPTYWNTPFTKICLGMKVDQKFRSVIIHKSANSLHSLIADGQYHHTSLGPETWNSLIGPKASLQQHCNMEGFNVQANIKARIGIVSNQENHCESCDSKIGFGLKGYPDKENTCGNAARADVGSDNGGKRIKGMGYIFVQ